MFLQYPYYKHESLRGCTLLLGNNDWDTGKIVLGVSHANDPLENNLAPGAERGALGPDEHVVETELNIRFDTHAAKIMNVPSAPPCRVPRPFSVQRNSAHKSH